MSARARRLLALGAPLAVLTLWTLPPPGLPAAPGPDGAYAWALNALPGAGALHGRDVVFPYGPLGWLAVPLPLDRHVERALPFRLGLQALLALALGWLAATGAGAGRLAAFVAVELAAFELLARTPEAQWTLLVPLLLAPDLAGRRPLPGAAVLAGALAGVFALVKVTLALTAGGFLLVWVAARAGARAPGWWRAPLAAAGVALAILLAALPLFGGLGGFGAWLAGQAELLAGFGAAMSLPAPAGALAGGVLVALLPLALAVAAARRRAPSAWLWAALAVPVLLAFRHGFVRADVHVPIALATATGTVAVALLVVADGAELRRAAAAAGLVLLVAVATSRAVTTGDAPAARRAARWARVTASVAGYLAPRAHAERLQAASARLLAGERFAAAPPVPPGTTFDVLPWNLAALAANGLAWRPNPVLQLYHAYTPALDERVARQLALPHRAGRLLVHLEAIDGRHPLWEAPLTWTAVTATHRIEPWAPGPGWLALAPRAPFASVEERPLGALALGADWAELPHLAAGESLVAALDFTPTFSGRLHALLFGIQPVLVDCELDDGDRRSWRLVPATAGGGILLDRPARTLDEVARALATTDGPRIHRVRLVGPGLRSYRTPVAAALSARRLRP